MEELVFESSPSTSIEQGQRLVALGVKPETADMVHRHMKSVDSYELIHFPFSRIMHMRENINKNPVLKLTGDDLYGKDMPAWSLWRLIEMLPLTLIDIRDGQYYSLVYDIHRDWVCYMSYAYGRECPYNRTLWDTQNCNPYDAFIDCIEWLINEDRFKKEYLWK